jgi:hypothetical protein
MTTDWFDTTFLEDGAVRICYQDSCGWVTSAHLVVPKALQLRTHYNNKRNALHPEHPKMP